MGWDNALAPRPHHADPAAGPTDPHIAPALRNNNSATSDAPAARDTAIARSLQGCRHPGGPGSMLRCRGSRAPLAPGPHPSTQPGGRGSTHGPAARARSAWQTPQTEPQWRSPGTGALCLQPHEASMPTARLRAGLGAAAVKVTTNGSVHKPGHGRQSKNTQHEYCGLAPCVDAPPWFLPAPWQGKPSRGLGEGLCAPRPTQRRGGQGRTAAHWQT